MGALSGKFAIVTGGTAGIGRASAMNLARDGARLIVTGRSADRAEKIKPLIDSGQAIYVQQDTTQESSWPIIIDTALKHFGRIDILVNNAGAIAVKLLDAMTHDDLKRMLHANLDSVFCGIKAVWPTMVAQKGGVIVNISALMGERTAGIGMAYTPAKAAQQSLSKTAALEGAAHNIRVVSVLPGLIWSDGWVRMAGPDPEKTKAGLGPTIPMGRVGEPGEVGEMVAFLCSDDARMITGVDIPVDGGKSAG
jgi:NAD(P)-dependent dehydrogenase (short-subunit alcohol dehydrogenase family)